MVVVAIALIGDAPESEIAMRRRDIERDLEKNDRITTAVLTLAVADEPTLTFDP